MFASFQSPPCSTGNEADIRRRAKDAESDRPTLEKFLSMGRIDAVNKVKELFDDGQGKTYESLIAAADAAAAAKKKKK